MGYFLGQAKLVCWVIDGSSSVADHSYLPAQNDVVWFSKQINCNLSRLAEEATPIDTLINIAATNVARQYRSLIGMQVDVPSFALPSASVSLLQIQKEGDDFELELSELGDCTTLIKNKNTNIVSIFGGGWNSETENQLRETVRTLKKQGVTSDRDVEAALSEQLRERRASLNNMPNPIVLTLNPNEGFAVRKHTTTLKAGDSILIMSDGFYRAVDLYGLFVKESLFEAVESQGLPAIVDHIRKYEHEAGLQDIEAVKASDDASAAYIRLLD